MKVKLKTKRDLLQFQSVQKMIANLRQKRGGIASKSTESGFLTYVFRYVRFFSVEKGIRTWTPDEIIAERKAHWESKDDDVRRQHEEIVVRFLNMLRQEKVQGKISSSGKVAYALTAVRAFYRANYRELKGIPTPSIITQTQYMVPTKEELARACEEASPRLKTWMLCDKDCGMSPIDLLNLTGREVSQRYGTIKQQLSKGICPIHIRIIREKVKTSSVGFYDTFVGEEGFQALSEYLKNKRGYRRFFNIGERMLEIEFNKLGKKMRWINFVPKSCRKFFKSQLTIEGNISDALTEYWMGHSLTRVTGAYLVERLREHPEKLRDLYVKAYQFLKLLP